MIDTAMLHCAAKEIWHQIQPESSRVVPNWNDDAEVFPSPHGMVILPTQSLMKLRTTIKMGKVMLSILRLEFQRIEIMSLTSQNLCSIKAE